MSQWGQNMSFAALAIVGVSLVCTAVLDYVAVRKRKRRRLPHEVLMVAAPPGATGTVTWDDASAASSWIASVLMKRWHMRALYEDSRWFQCGRSLDEKEKDNNMQHWDARVATAVYAIDDLNIVLDQLTFICPAKHYMVFLNHSWTAWTVHPGGVRYIEFGFRTSEMRRRQRDDSEDYYSTSNRAFYIISQHSTSGKVCGTLNGPMETKSGGSTASGTATAGCRPSNMQMNPRGGSTASAYKLISR